MENPFASFNEHLKEPGALDIENAKLIYDGIVNSFLKNDPEYRNLWESAIDAAIKYAAYRADWYSWDREKRLNEDEYRSSKHNAFITRINMLARYAREKGDPSLWKEILGDERKRAGDFACYIALARSLYAR